MPRKITKSLIPVVDLFAGPGGLGEGFSRANGGASFRIALSVEMEKYAHETLTLRNFYRQFQEGLAPVEYYEHLRKGAPLKERDGLFGENYPNQWSSAQSEALQVEMGPESRKGLEARIKRLGVEDDCVVIGGPPCQAFSLVGRSRNKGTKDYEAGEDNRHFLYREYLHKLCLLRPKAFVMENVKGILSSKVEQHGIFAQILEDLQSPGKALNKRSRPKYRLFPLTPRNSRSLEDGAWGANDFVIRAEDFGVPQARHRVIVVGIREDQVKPGRKISLTPQAPHSVWETIQDLPPVHPSNSKGLGGVEDWIQCVRGAVSSKVLRSVKPDIAAAMKSSLQALGRRTRLSKTGGAFLPLRGKSQYLRGMSMEDSLFHWLKSYPLQGWCNHETRAHMPSDFARYLFASCFADLRGRSPKSPDYPKSLWPNHSNFSESIRSGHLFNDRFRVQRKSSPATTITSHMSRDGHGFIHPDPVQCRSLTPREAARLQTFPDDYFFCGPRTAQYIQIGNAVPPFLAVNLASALADYLAS